MHDVATIVSLVETARTRVTAVTATMALGDQLAAAVATTQLHACLEELRSRAPNYPHATSVVADALGKVPVHGVESGSLHTRGGDRLRTIGMI